MLLLGSLANSTVEATTVDRVALRVNDRIATSVEFEQALEARRRAVLASDLEGERRRAALAEAGESVAHDLYVELLLLARADQLDIEITDDELAAATQQLRQRLDLESDEAFEQALASQGMDRERLERQLRRNVLVQKIMAQEIRPRVEVDRSESRRYYEEHLDEFRAPERLELVDAVVTEAAASTVAERRRIAAEVRSELMTGGDVDEIAAAFEDREGVEVVDLGWIGSGDLDPALEEAAWDLEPNEVTEAVEARGAIHVVRLEQRQQSDVRPFGEVDEEIRERQRSERLEEEYATYLEEIEEGAYIVMDLPEEAAGFEGLGDDGDDGPEIPSGGLDVEQEEATLPDAPADD